MNELALLVQAELMARVHRWDRITDWTQYSLRGNELAAMALALTWLCGFDVPGSVTRVAVALLATNWLVHRLCMKRYKSILRVAFKVMGPCDDPTCLACRTLGSA